jgi:ADP-ribose pyrophosphatase YjhB (NUDIX family)
MTPEPTGEERTDSPPPNPESPIPTLPGNIISVGAFVVRDESVLVVRLTYGPTAGKYSLPGGWLDVGEDIDSAAAREVAEETGVEARCLGVVGLRVRANVERSQTDLIWLLEHVSGEPRADEQETDDARYMTFDEITSRDDVEEIVGKITTRYRANQLQTLCLDGMNVDGADTPTPEREEWKLFV